MTGDANYWKEKYLDSLQQQEESEAQWNSRMDVLRRSLTRTSMAAEGQSQGLDECLQDLRKALHKDHFERFLEEITPRLEKALLEFDQQRQDRIQHISQSLHQLAAQLQQTNPAPRELRKALKHFPKRLDERVGQWSELQSLLQELESLQRQALLPTPEPAKKAPQAQQSAAAKEQRGFWQRLFGFPWWRSSSQPKKVVDTTSVAVAPSTAVSEPELASVKPDVTEPETPQPEQQLTPAPLEPKPIEPFVQPPADVAPPAVALEPLLEKEVNSEPELAAVSIPSLRLPAQQREIEAESTPTGPLIPRDDSAPEPLAETAQPLPASMPETAVSTDTPAGDLSPTDTLAESPPYSLLADQIEHILLGLLDNLCLVDHWQAQADVLRRRIKNGLNWYELVTVLEDLACLLHALPLFDRQFEDYLKQLNDRLAIMQDSLNQVQLGRSQTSQATVAFDSCLRQQVEGLQTSVEQATDLPSLKLLVEERLESIVSAIDSYQRQCQENEQQLEASLTQLSERLISMESLSSELQGHLEEQQRKAQFDVLTGLPNRAALNDRLEHEIQRWKHNASSLLLAVLDVDHFKNINDSFGHLAGDRVLKILAGRWQEQIRSSDFLARYGGEEFVLLLPNTDLEAGLTLLERLRQSTEECPFHFKGERLQITVSIGVTGFTADHSTEEIFEQADQALYRAKNSGRNRIEHQ
ncbi:diguanylate cyclase [Azomonas agilis]|uniref:diguanylate cyclase n=1 Tax=Azomonas agilis TaxID=116849 RepID=A0A562IKW6_9GAMM|nr:GGDEF domain-containing protein [Azomonas agilis]TWH71333.1 diguanylate cyclase [Azomonas agilis]